MNTREAKVPIIYYPWGQGTNYLQYVMHFNSKTLLVYLNKTTESDDSGHPTLAKIC